jgi:Sec7-like guanine-nucleotide exchange factor
MIKPASKQIMFAQRDIEGIKDKDAVYVIAFSIIMLNTDQHNAQVKVIYVLLLLFS